MSKLEQIFHDYWNDPDRVYFTSEYIRFADHVNSLVKNDPDMEWMDDPKTALLVRHVLRLEEEEKNIFHPVVAKSLKRKKPFVLGKAGDSTIDPINPFDIEFEPFDTEEKAIIGPCNAVKIDIAPEHSLGLTNEPLPVLKFHVSATVENEEHVNLVKDSCEDIELFLERERALFGHGVAMFLVLPNYAIFDIISHQSGSWNFQYAQDFYEGSLAEMINVIFDRFGDKV